MRELRVLCLCNRLLGNSTFSKTLKKVIDGIPFISAEYVFLDSKDYFRHPAPEYFRISKSAETLWVIKQKIKSVDFARYDLIVAQGFEMAWALKGRAKGIPCIMFNDATPVISHRLIFQYYDKIFWRLRSLLFIFIYKYFFHNIFNHVNICLPRTTWCAKSLMRDFGVDSEKIYVCSPAVDIFVWKPKSTSEKNERIRLLFVGNDFERKGGRQLLRIYGSLSQDVDLYIVSNDPVLEELNLKQGVQHLRDIPYNELPEIFQEADIFIFPTLKEHLGMVQVEAAACGLPIISRDVGGINDIVKDGYNGYLLPYHSSEEQWVEKIQYLINHPEERRRMGANSRKLAEEMFSMERFEKTIRQAIDKALKNE